MSLDRRLEYDASPPADGDSFDDQPQSTESEDDGSGNDVRTILSVGSAVGLGAFIAVYLVAYQLSLAARNGISWSEGEPGAWMTAGIVTLTSHGGTFVEDPERLPYVAATGAQTATQLLPLVIVMALVVAGVLVGRVLEPSTPKTTAAYAGSIIPAYVGSLAVLTRLARYTPPDDRPQTGSQNIWLLFEVETVAVSLDASFLLTTTALAFVFAFAGATFARRAVLFPSTFEPRVERTVTLPTNEAGETSDTVERETGAMPTSSAGNGNADSSGLPQNLSRETDESDTKTARGHRNDGAEGVTSDDHTRYRPGGASDGRANRDRSSDRDHDRYRPSDD
ncbi:hypothetical protein ACFQMM_13630 [Saliphagus sp. GCM10025308]